ncbi:aquaporin-9-like [Pecten maximus]|uniref:aquaporin-9-like n=1 Tax=Pecten maximus TaxID=6579 RepID=UPI00145833B5|nr:aquaporin-9-like [Pecten maximus]
MSSLKKLTRLQNPLAREIIAEYIGTFILVTFAIGSGAQYVLSRQEFSSFLTVNFAGGMGLTLGIYFSGGVSGGSLNPAVTLALCLSGRVPWFKWPFYSIAELAGAFTAAAVQFGIYYDAINHFDSGYRQTTGANATAGIFATYPQEFVSTTNTFFDQVFGTFLLISCILAITDKRNMLPHLGLQPLALGSIVFAIGTSFGFNCGYAINPARDLGPRIFTAIAGYGTEPFSYRDYNWFWVPIVGPMVGSFLGWAVYAITIENHWPPDENNLNEEGVIGDLDRAVSEKNHDGYINHGYHKEIEDLPHHI